MNDTRIFNELRESHHRATAITVSIVDQVTTGHLRLPTPCTGWDLGRLLAHMTGQNHGFAAAARGHGPDVDLFADRTVDDDPAGLFRASAADVTAAFAEPSAADRGWYLAELNDEKPFTAQRAIGFHLLDTAVHGWDVAASLGVPISFTEDVTATVLRIADGLPDGQARIEQGAYFQPSVNSPESASTFDRALAVLGRDPDWTHGG